MLNLLFFFGLLSAFAPTSEAAADLADRIQIDRVHGSSKVKVLREGRALELVQGDALLVGDEISTVAAQIVELSSWDKSAWKVAPESRLKIEARQSQRRSIFFWTFQLLKGAMWGQVAKDLADKEGFRLKVRTKNSSLGIRGTEYLLSGGEESSEVDVLEGVVWWGKDPGFATGTYREVRAGQHAETGADGKIRVRKSEGSLPEIAHRYRVVPQADATSAP